MLVTVSHLDIRICRCCHGDGEGGLLWGVSNGEFEGCLLERTIDTACGPVYHGCVKEGVERAQADRKDHKSRRIEGSLEAGEQAQLVEGL